MKKIMMVSLLAMGISAPLLAQATDLVLHNYADKPATSLINNTSCSYPMMGEIGITDPGETDIIPYKTISGACTGNKSNCPAVVYLTGNCSGAAFATVYINVSGSGTEGIITTGPIVKDGYTLTVNGPFEVTLTKN